jgi:hypothetical protein
MTFVPGPCRASGKADTRLSQAADPVPFPELGKADTRSGKGTGSTACETAPERTPVKAREFARRILTSTRLHRMTACRSYAIGYFPGTVSRSCCWLILMPAAYSKAMINGEWRSWAKAHRATRQTINTAFHQAATAEVLRHQAFTTADPYQRASVATN